MLREADLTQDERGDAGDDEQHANDRDRLHAKNLPMPYPRPTYVAGPSRSSTARGRLHDSGASFDKLRMRATFGGAKTLPHPELVEGRTVPIQRRVPSLQREPLHLDAAVEVAVGTGRLLPAAADDLDALGVDLRMLLQQGDPHGIRALLRQLHGLQGHG